MSGSDGTWVLQKDATGSDLQGKANVKKSRNNTKDKSNSDTTTATTETSGSSIPISSSAEIGKDSPYSDGETKTESKKNDRGEHPLGSSRKWKDKDEELQSAAFVIIQGGNST